MKQEFLLEANRLVKNYKNFTALKGVTFQIIQGEYLGLLGPNGAGKTTILKMLYGVTKPTEGKITLFGKP